MTEQCGSLEPREPHYPFAAPGWLPTWHCYQRKESTALKNAAQNMKPVFSWLHEASFRAFRNEDTTLTAVLSLNEERIRRAFIHYQKFHCTNQRIQDRTQTSAVSQLNFYWKHGTYICGHMALRVRCRYLYSKRHSKTKDTKQGRLCSKHTGHHVEPPLPVHVVHR